MSKAGPLKHDCFGSMFDFPRITFYKSLSSIFKGRTFLILQVGRLPLDFHVTPITVMRIRRIKHGSSAAVDHDAAEYLLQNSVVIKSASA
jgi:hypothetical protein